MRRVFQVGVIGLGFIGPVHIEALRRLGNVQVVAVSDVVGAGEKAEELNIDHAYEDWRDLLNHEGLDCVHICTPNNTHYPIAKAAIERELHVLCEKPLAMTAAEAAELVALAEEKKVGNAIGLNVRFYPLIHQARSMVEAGELGRIFSVGGYYQQDWLLLDTDWSWRLLPEFSGESRAVADIGPHWFDSVEFITRKRVKQVCADFATFHELRRRPLKPVATYSGMALRPEDYREESIRTEDYASVLLRFEEGVHGSLTVNQCAAGYRNQMYIGICGEKASLAFNSERPEELWIGRRGRPNMVMPRDPSLMDEFSAGLTNHPGGHNEGFPDTTKQLFKKFYAYLEQGGPQSGAPVEFPQFTDGRRDMDICSAVALSARESRWVTV